MAMKVTNLCADYKGESSSIILMSDSSRSIINVSNMNIVYNSDSKAQNEQQLKAHAIGLLQEAISALSKQSSILSSFVYKSQYFLHSVE